MCSSLKFLVFGAGAVGQAIGCMLSADGHRVDMIVRQRYIDVLMRDGLKVTGIFGDYLANSGLTGYYVSIENVKSKTYDYVLITTKSYDTSVAVIETGKLENQDFVVVSMQNGCGNFEKVVERYGELRSLAARVITGFEIESPGLVRITVTADAVHVGGNREGAVPDSALKLANILNKAGLPTDTTPYVRRDLFAKLLYNSALNPLGASLGVHYGALGDDSDSRAIMSAIIHEVFAVIKAMGAQTNWDTPEEYKRFFYEKQVPATYNHRSSMLQDLERGKQTEIDALTGYISTEGRRLNVPTPVCDTITGLIRFMERQRKQG
ncbi:MAG: 2-dehydropantoate 2-reductase [Candidatus Latescibacteria bacterium]|nr:2-dehydropantoate 2-reductase [Candidatus Latescibacterota bacterium]